MVAAWSLSAFAQDSQPARKSSLPELCERIPLGAKERGSFILSSPGQFLRAYEISNKGIPFTVGVDDTKRVRFLTTTSLEFRTPDGVDLKWTYEKVSKEFKKKV